MFHAAHLQARLLWVVQLGQQRRRHDATKGLWAAGKHRMLRKLVHRAGSAASGWPGASPASQWATCACHAAPVPLPSIATLIRCPFCRRAPARECSTTRLPAKAKEAAAALTRKGKPTRVFLPVDACSTCTWPLQTEAGAQRRGSIECALVADMGPGTSWVPHASWQQLQGHACGPPGYNQTNSSSATAACSVLLHMHTE